MSHHPPNPQSQARSHFMYIIIRNRMSHFLSRPHSFPFLFRSRKSRSRIKILLQHFFVFFFNIFLLPLFRIDQLCIQIFHWSDSPFPLTFHLPFSDIVIPDRNLRQNKKKKTSKNKLPTSISFDRKAVLYISRN